MDPDNPAVVTSVRSEIEAAAIVAALAEHGMEASTTGGYTSGFQAEAPGLVHVIVRQSELERAQQALQALRTTDTKVDWSQIDVGEPED